MKQEIRDRVALSIIPGVGAVLYKKLINHFGSASTVLSMPYSEIVSVHGIGKKLATSISNHLTCISKAEKILQECEAENIQIISYDDHRYPFRLREIYDAPVLLYCKGNTEVLSNKTISIVGTRNATNYGRSIVENIIAELSNTDCTTISGLAYGIDIEAHLHSIKKKIPTIGVMANGLDMVYPSLHRKTAHDMCLNGGVLSEFPPGEKPDPGKFPARNRIIAGLSDVTIVVEAAAKGGALITAEMANDYNREVFAVPGNVERKYSAGCNKLIQQNKAHIFTNTDDLLEMMNWAEEVSTKNKHVRHIEHLDLPKLQKIILSEIKSYHQIPIEIISKNTGFSLNEISPLLLELELENYITSSPGNHYKLNHSMVA